MPLFCFLVFTANVRMVQAIPLAMLPSLANVHVELLMFRGDKVCDLTMCIPIVALAVLDGINVVDPHQQQLVMHLRQCRLQGSLQSVVDIGTDLVSCNGMRKNQAQGREISIWRLLFYFMGNCPQHPGDACAFRYFLAVAFVQQ